MKRVTDPGHPLYVPPGNRRIAQERAQQNVERIADYLAVRDSIPTGTAEEGKVRARRRRSVRLLGGTEKDWKNWKWQMRRVIRDPELLSRIVSLDEGERDEIARTARRYRWAISPYYASLMDPEDRACPVRLQAIPSIREHIDAEEERDAYAVVYNSPAPLITRLYADRIIINVTNICAMFCRHCLRKKDIDLKDTIYPKEEVRAALQYVAECPEIRDVLITGGDALSLSDDYLDWILTQLDKIPHLEVKRLGSRMIATLPQRVTPDLCRMLAHHKPLYLNTQFNHPAEITEESSAAVDRLVGAGVIVGNQSVLLKGINDDKHVMKKLVQELLRIRVRPYYIFNCKKLEGIRHFRAPVATGLNIIENLRGYTSGLAVPTFIITAPEGKGKTPLAPTYLLNYNRNGKLLFRTWAGEVCEYEDELLES